MAKRSTKLTADRRTVHGQAGTIGTTFAGRKPREERTRRMHGRATQGACSGHEKCRHCGKGLPEQVAHLT